jgi:hypothetical protein
MVETDLPFVARTAQMLMAISCDHRLQMRNTVSLLPPSWGTLYQLSTLDNDEWDQAMERGAIRPDMTRGDARRLRIVPGHLALRAGETPAPRPPSLKAAAMAIVVHVGDQDIEADVLVTVPYGLVRALRDCLAL